MHHHDHDDEPYIVIEKHSSGTGTLLLGVLIGAGVALLFAPRTGEETRRVLTRRARRTADTVKGAAQEVGGQVADTFENARYRVEEQIELARTTIEMKKRQVSRAVEAGRDAAQQARVDLERRLAETKAQYAAGEGGRAPAGRSAIPVPGDDDLG